MTHVLYGVSYNIYATGGIGNRNLMVLENKTELFVAESDMLRRVASLKNEKCIGEIEPFVESVSKSECRISQRETSVKNKPIYLHSLNAYNFRHGTENPLVLGLVRYTPKNFKERPCIQVLYESDNKIDYIACSEVMNHNWEFI